MYAWILFYVSELFLVLSCRFRGIKTYWLAGAIAIVFSGFRYQVGNDYFAYQEMARNPQDFYGNIEPGFYFLLIVLNYFFDRPEHILFFVMSFFTVFFVMKALTNFKDREYIFLIYLIVPGLFINSFHLIRQMLSVSIFFYAVISSLNTKSHIKYIVLGVAATSIHFTAIIPFLFGMLIRRYSKLNISTGVLCLIFAISFFGWYLNIPATVLANLGDTRYEIYSVWIDEESPLKIIFFNALTFFYFYMLKNTSENIAASLFFKYWLVGIFVLNLFASFSPVVRMTYYFFIFGLPLFALVTRPLHLKYRVCYRLVYMLIYMYSLILAINKNEDIAQAATGNANSLLNYNFLPLE